MDVRLFCAQEKNSNQNHLITVRELSQLLNVKESTLYQWAELGQIPCIKLMVLSGSISMISSNGYSLVKGSLFQTIIHYSGWKGSERRKKLNEPLQKKRQRSMVGISQIRWQAFQNIHRDRKQKAG